MKGVYALSLLTYRADFDGKVVSSDLSKHIEQRGDKIPAGQWVS